MLTKHLFSVTDVLKCADKYSYVPFVPLEVKESISNLKSGKSAIIDHVNSEHFSYTSDKIYVYLCILVNAMMIHRHVPSTLMDTILISLMKDKRVSITIGL